MIKLSIIIPVYNAEKYLHKCLNSIVVQGLNDSSEIVLINDGSSDRSLEIAESYKDKIVNYHIYSHANQGEAVSRNVALTKTQGEYITFLDSDDYYETDALRNALTIVQRDNLDILYLRIKQEDEEGNFIDFVYDFPSKGAICHGLNHGRRPFPATIYKRKILGDITFPLGILVGPDSVFNAMVQSRAERVSFTDSAIYNYTFRLNSLSKEGKSEKAFRGFLKAIEELRHFQQFHFKDNPDAKLYFDRMYAIFVTRILELNVMPEWKRALFNELVMLLKNKELLYILDLFSSKYPYVAKSFGLFKSYQKYLAFKSNIYSLLFRYKKF